MDWSSLARWMSLAALLALATSACSYPWRTQSSSKPFCSAPEPGEEGQPTRWLLHSLPRDTPALPHSALVTSALSGTWEMLTVTTEGAIGTEPERWTLRFVAADSEGARTSCLVSPCRARARTVAVGRSLRSDAPFDSAAISHTMSDPARIVARYDSTNGYLTLAFGPPMNDAGVFYAVTRLSDTTMRGRWTGGSYILAQVRRGNVTTWEHEQGFFCGRRVFPDRDHDQSPNDR